MDTKCDNGKQGFPGPSRTRFFHGMLLTDEDFCNEQNYHLERFKALNRHTWGSGVLSGLELTLAAGGNSLQVGKGAALDCDGNLIELPQCDTVDIRDLRCPPCPSACKQEDGKPITRLIGLRHMTRDQDPVPAYDPAGDCDHRSCEPSRTREGYCLELLCESACPDPCGGFGESRCETSAGGCSDVPDDKDKVKGRCGLPYPEPCCGNSLVILGKVSIDCSKDKPEPKVSCRSCRSVIVTPRWAGFVVCMVLEWFEAEKEAAKRQEIEGMNQDEMAERDPKLKLLRELVAGLEVDVGALRRMLTLSLDPATLVELIKPQGGAAEEVGDQDNEQDGDNKDEENPVAPAAPSAPSGGGGGA